MRAPAAVGVAIVLGVGACRGSTTVHEQSACSKGMAAANARASGKSIQSDRAAFLPTLQSCPTIEEWARGAEAAGLQVNDPTKAVAAICDLATPRLQEAEICQQTHGLAPFG